MSKFAISINWIDINDDAPCSHNPSAIGSMLVLGSRMVAGKLGERLSTQKIAGQTLPQDITYFAEWTKYHPSLMRAEWAFMEDEIFLVVQKYFVANTSYHRNGVYHSAPDDFYRICGNDWSLCFNIARGASTSYPTYSDYIAYMSFYGMGCSSADCDVLSMGSVDAFESDVALYTLLGYFAHPQE